MKDKPVLLLGNGCRGNKKLIEYLTSLNIPCLCTWMGIDLIHENSPVFCGRPGILGQRAANIIQQSATRIYCFGARLDTGQVAYNYDNFAPKATKFVYDTDLNELMKLPNSWTKLLQDLECDIDPQIEPGNTTWLSFCKSLYELYGAEFEGKTNLDFVDPFSFTSYLSSMCTSTDVIATGSSGQCAEVMMQTFKVKEGQRVMNVSTIGAMGADVPTAIGACLASGRKRTICVTGDGGVMLNIQELEVVRRLNLPIKLFVFNNNGYGSIRSMQQARFNHKVGCDPSSDFTIPSIEPLVKAFKLGYQYIHSTYELKDIRNFHSDYPMVYELNIDPNFKQFPKVDSPNLVIDPMEDMTPKLGEQRLKELMEW